MIETPTASQWGSVWAGNQESAEWVSRAVEEEEDGVRCRRILEYLHAALGDLAGKRSIEIGCGAATYSLIMARRGAGPTLLDYSPEALSLAANRLKWLGLQGELLEANAFNFPKEMRGSFDIAMSFGTVEHYRYPERLAICQSHLDLIKPGGVVVISVPNVWFLPHELLKVLLASRGKWFLGYEGSFSRQELWSVGKRLRLKNAMIVGSSFQGDLAHYFNVVRHTRTVQQWWSAKKSDVTRDVKAQVPCWLDNFFGYALVLLGVKC